MQQVGGSDLALQERVDRMIRNYRVRGHVAAQLDPLGRVKPTPPPELDAQFYGFSDTDMEREFVSEAMDPDHLRDGVMVLREIVDRLKSTYCRSIGVQYMHIDDLGVREWLQRRMEGTGNRITLPRS